MFRLTKTLRTAHNFKTAKKPKNSLNREIPIVHLFICSFVHLFICSPGAVRGKNCSSDQRHERRWAGECSHTHPDLEWVPSKTLCQICFIILKLTFLFVVFLLLHKQANKNKDMNKTPPKNEKNNLNHLKLPRRTRLLAALVMRPSVLSPCCSAIHASVDLWGKRRGRVGGSRGEEGKAIHALSLWESGGRREG